MEIGEQEQSGPQESELSRQHLFHLYEQLHVAGHSTALSRRLAPAAAYCSSGSQNQRLHPFDQHLVPGF